MGGNSWPGAVSVGEADAGHAFAEAALFDELGFEGFELLVDEEVEIIDDFGFLEGAQEAVVSPGDEDAFWLWGMGRMGVMGRMGGMGIMLPIISTACQQGSPFSRKTVLPGW